MRFNEDYPLAYAIYHPQDKIRIKSTFFEEAYTFASA
jgi:hypothetical protein